MKKFICILSEQKLATTSNACSFIFVSYHVNGKKNKTKKKTKNKSAKNLKFVKIVFVNEIKLKFSNILYLFVFLHN